MLNNELEKGLKDRLYDLEEKVDTDATWLAVQAGIQPEKKRRRGIIWWWLSGCFALLALGGWLIWSPDVAAPPGLHSGDLPETEVFVGSLEKEYPERDKGAIAGNDPVSDPKREGGTTTAPGAGRATEQKAPNGLTAGATGRGNKPAPTSPAPARRRPERTEAKASLITPTAAVLTDAPGSGESVSPAPMETVIAEGRIAAATVPSLPLALLPNAVVFSLPLEPVNYSTFEKARKQRWTLGAGAGLAMPFRAISVALPDSVGQEPRNPDGERLLEAVTADLLVGYRTGNNWTLRGGLSYQRVNAVVELRSDSTAEIRREGITEIIIGASGDTTFVTGSITESNRTSTVNRYYNNLTTVDVPVLLGKTFSRGRWRIGVEAGPVFNLLTSGSARYLLADGTFSTRAQNDGLFRKRLGGVSWRADVSAGVLLAPGLQVELGLSALRRGRGGFEVDGSATQTAYDLLGVRLGIRRSF